MLESIISATDAIKITLSLLSIMLGLTSWLLLREITKVKKAIAIICAADPELTKKVTNFLKLPTTENKED